DRTDTNGQSVEPGRYVVHARMGGASARAMIEDGRAHPEPPQPVHGGLARPIAPWAFVVDGNTVRGLHVQFSIDRATGDIRDFNVDGNRLFDSIRVAGGNPIREIRNDGMLFLRGEREAFGFMDVPGGAFLTAPCAPSGESVGIGIQVATGIDVKSDGRYVRLDGAANGMIARTDGGDITQDGRQIATEIVAEGIACEPKTEEMPRAMLGFRGGGFEGERPSPLEPEKARALAAGRLGAEATIDANGERPVLRNQDYGVEVKLKDASEGSATLTVDSPNHEGKVVTFRLPKKILSAVTPEEVRLLFDGNGARLASDVREVINGCDEPLYVVVLTAESVDVMLCVPHFSEHTVTIQSSAAALGSAPAWIGALAGLGAVGAGAALVARKH
ncbi:MAG TPA: hypothetical protein VI565_05395, partial [Burkholderiales bacterium]|nr:hypothetical protein [Burkholderiales bacterium]